MPPKNQAHLPGLGVSPQCLASNAAGSQLEADRAPEQSCRRRQQPEEAGLAAPHQDEVRGAHEQQRQVAADRQFQPASDRAHARPGGSGQGRLQDPGVKEELTCQAGQKRQGGPEEVDQSFRAAPRCSAEGSGCTRGP